MNQDDWIKLAREHDGMDSGGLVKFDTEDFLVFCQALADKVREEDAKVSSLALIIPWHRVLREMPETIWWKYDEWVMVGKFLNELSKIRAKIGGDDGLQEHV